MTNIKIALIGDYSAKVTAHQAIPLALRQAVRICETPVEEVWIGTDAIQTDVELQLSSFHAVWCVPASPYASMEGALRAIRFARETGRPFLGTCGGFQHALIEYARNVLGMTGADHAESNPDAEIRLIQQLECALVEKAGRILLEPGSRLGTIYGRNEIEETYHCSYGLNPQFKAQLTAGDLRIGGYDESGEVRAVELTSHPFYLCTLFQPERTGLKGEAHPLINAFIQASLAYMRRGD